MVGAKGVGLAHRQAAWNEKGEGGCCQKAGGYYASDVGHR